MGISMKLQHYVYPHRNIGGRPHQRIMTLDTLIGFDIFRRKTHLLQRVEGKGVCQTLSEGTYGDGKWIDIIL